MFSIPAHKSGTAGQVINLLPEGYGEPAQPAQPSISDAVQALYGKPQYEVRALRECRKGEYIRRLNAHGTGQKTYKRGEYDRSSRKYELIDCDDTNRTIWLGGHLLVAVDFTY